MVKISKRKATNIILRLAKHIPFLFPKGVVWFSKDFREGNAVKYSSENDRKIKKISYFSGDFKWKGITLSSVLTKKEVSVLEERLGNLRLDNFIGKHTQLSKTSIENYGCFSYDLGVFNINRSISYDSLGSLNVKNDFFLGVYVSLFKSPSGFFIITYYF
ncbi:hypothetical protein R2306_004044, partial [Cronobacter sakazakii]|nr:hypothetical protein [Cronobacter sakazakii]